MAIALTVILVGGCASKPIEIVETADQSTTESGLQSVDVSSTEDKSEALIARDFAHVLPQVPGLNPDQITLSISPDVTGNFEFAEELRMALFQEGYAVRIGEDSDSAVNLSYQIRDSNKPVSGIVDESPDESTIVYELGVGGIRLRRRYNKQVDGRAQPVSPMEGRGFEGSAIVVDNSIFKDTGADNTDHRDRMVPPEVVLPVDQRMSTSDEPMSPAMEPLSPATEPLSLIDKPTDPLGGPSSFVEDSLISAQDSPSPDEGSVDTGEVVSAISRQSVATAEPIRLPEKSALVAFDDTSNVRELGQSNYHDAFWATGVLYRHVLSFSNDSTVLTPDSLEKLQNVVENFDVSQDLVSITGTSHGKGAYEGAQEDLARARARAARNTLLVRGIRSDNIFPEASWSETYYDDVMPRRAAVIEVRRLVTQE